MTAVYDMDMNFRDRELWYHSRRLIIEVFKVTAALTDEDFETTKAMRNDCVSIASNIAWAFAAKGEESKLAYLQTALTTVRNIEQHLLRTRLHGLVSPAECEKLLHEIDRIKAKIAIGDSDRLN